MIYAVCVSPVVTLAVVGCSQLDTGIAIWKRQVKGALGGASQTEDGDRTEMFGVKFESIGIYEFRG